MSTDRQQLDWAADGTFPGNERQLIRKEIKWRDSMIESKQSSAELQGK